jgi:hypothetical protein
MSEIYKTIFKEKKKLAKRLCKMVKPLLWKPAQYEKLLFDFGTAKLRETYKIPKGIVIAEFQGFTDTGIISDSHAGGLSTCDFINYPIEDLIRMENFLTKKIERFKQAKKAMKDT